VDFFGHPAATTRAVALAVQQTKAPLVVVGLVYRGNDRYEVLWSHCEIEELLESDLSRDEKTLQITEMITRKYEALICESPSEWFWMHRRWKTQPSDDAPSVYTA
jgi:KDO2-lipid IV(A) lauroyltransferase